MDFQPSARSAALVDQLQAFIDERVVPAQHAYDAAMASAPGEQPAVMEELKAAAKADGLWNLCVRHPDYGPGLSFADGPDEVHSMGIARRELRRHNQTSSNPT